MYKIIKENETIEVAKVTFVKKMETNNLIMVCKKSEATGIVTETGEGFYQLEGEDYLGDYPTVTLIEMANSIETTKLEEIKETLESIENGNLQFQMEWDARLTDLEINLKGGEQDDI